ncbi:MAG: hypothetical protein IIC93_09000 [Chloroflexi bacterium]|nr:hypothetical protein [Chloroflexota bacterium]
MLVIAAIVALACGSGITHPAQELRPGPTPELPRWATQDRLISVVKWTDQVVEGANGVRFVITQTSGLTGFFQNWYEAEGEMSEYSTHILIRTGNVYLETLEHVYLSPSFDQDGFLERGTWRFAAAVSVVSQFDDTVIELYE